MITMISGHFLPLVSFFQKKISCFLACLYICMCVDVKKPLYVGENVQNLGGICKILFFFFYLCGNVLFFIIKYFKCKFSNS